jgi:hypothetical protein
MAFYWRFSGAQGEELALHSIYLIFQMAVPLSLVSWCLNLPASRSDSAKEDREAKKIDDARMILFI